MHQLKRWSKPTLLALVAATLLISLSALALEPRPARASGPEDVVNSFVAAINKHDAAGASALFTPDGFFSVNDDGSFGAVGTVALASAFNPDDLPATVELTNVSVHGNTVEGVGRIVDDRSAAAGITRYLQPITAVIRGDKIAELHLSLDLTDAQTRTYLAYEQSQDGEDGEDDGPPPETVELPMTAASSGAPAGTAFLYEFDGQSGVAIQIEPGAAGVLQPAVILLGDCPHGSAIASRLAPVVDGESFTLTSLSKSELLAGDYAVAVENTNVGSGRYASCGEVESAAAVAAPPDDSPAPPPTTPPPPSGVITAPSTGTGPDGNGANAAGLLAGLMLAGVALAGTGAAMRTTRRS